MNSAQRKRNQCKYLGSRCAVSGRNTDAELHRWGHLQAYDFHHIDAVRKSPRYEGIVKRNCCSVDGLLELEKCLILRSDVHKNVEGQKLRGVINYDDGRKIPIASGLIDPDAEFGAVGHFFVDLEAVEVFFRVQRDSVVVLGKKHVLSSMNEWIQSSSDTTISDMAGRVVLEIKGREINVYRHWSIYPWKLNTDKRHEYYIYNRGLLYDPHWDLIIERPSDLRIVLASKTPIKSDSFRCEQTLLRQRP